MLIVPCGDVPVKHGRDGLHGVRRGNGFIHIARSRIIELFELRCWVLLILGILGLL